MRILLAVTAFLSLTACGKPATYKPEAHTKPVVMYIQACAKCHTPYQNDTPLAVIQSGNLDVAQVAEKIQTGGMMMPAFDQMTPQQRLALAEWLVEHN